MKTLNKAELYSSFDKYLSTKNILNVALIYFVWEGVSHQRQIHYGKTVMQGKERIQSTLRRNSSAFKKVDKIIIQKQYKKFCTFHSFNNLLQRQYGSIEFEELARKEAMVDKSTYLLRSDEIRNLNEQFFTYYQVHLALNILGYKNIYREIMVWDSDTSFTQILSDSMIQKYFQHSLGALIGLSRDASSIGHSVAVRRQGNKWLYIDSYEKKPISFNTNASMLKFIKQKGMTSIMFVYPRKIRLTSVVNRLFANNSSFHPLSKKHVVDIDKTTSKKQIDEYNKNYDLLTEKQKYELEVIRQLKNNIKEEYSKNYDLPTEKKKYKLEVIKQLKKHLKDAPQIIRSLCKRYPHLIT